MPRRCVKCGTNLSDKSFLLTPARCPACGGYWWQPWAASLAILSALAIGLLAGGLAASIAVVCARWLFGNINDAVLVAVVVLIVGCGTAHHFVWLWLWLAYPQMMYELMDGAETTSHDEGRWIIPWNHMKVAAVVLVGIPFVPASWGAKAFAGLGVLLWCLAFGRYAAWQWSKMPSQRRNGAE
ncbi:MAG TPA: hypothetical protein VMP01_14595 [Pirellulaceae bacterium]|nr:hypothetical protein [Pirellulaceae bacterium]